MTEERTNGLGNMASLMGSLGVPASVTDTLIPEAPAQEVVAEPAAVAPPSVGAPAPSVPAVPAEPVAEPAAVAPTDPASVPAAPVAAEPAAGTMEEAFSASITSPVYGGEFKIGQANEPSNPLEDKNFENIESFNSFLEKDYGIKSVKDLPEKIKEWKEAGGKIEELNTEVNNSRAIFSGMHPDLYAAIQADLNGKDWRESVSSNKIDFSKGVSEIEKERLVESMSPGVLTPEDWAEYKDPDGDPAVKRLVESTIRTSETSFEAKKASFDAARTKSVQDAVANKQAFQASVEAAKQGAKEQFENIDPAYVDSIAEMFEKGTINSLFYDEKGMLKPDAFARATMAKDGKGIVEQWEGIARNKVKTELTQEILSRGAETPVIPNGSVGTLPKEEVSQEVKDADSFIRGLGGATTY